MSYSDALLVENGENARINLEWVPNKAPEKTFGNQGACTFASITTDNSWYGYAKRTHVQIYGISLGKEIKKHLNSSGTWVKDQETVYSSNPASGDRPRSVDAYVPSPSGQKSGNTMKEWFYIPWESNSVKIIQTVQAYYDNTGDGVKNPTWNNVNGPLYYNGSGWQGSDTSVTCYSGFCEVIGAYGDGPGNIVTVGGKIHVQAKLTNTSRDALQLWGSQLIGTGGTHSNSAIIPSGGSAYFNFDINAPGSVQNYGFGFYPNYPGPGGGGRIGGDCHGSVPVYEPFTLVPHATLSYPGTKEYTRDITYSTYIQNNSSRHVAAPTTSKFTYTPYAAGIGCPSNGPVNTNGPYGPGGPNYTISPTVCKPATYEAGDLYCSRIDLTGYNQGYIGPGGPSDIRGASLNQSFAGSEQCVKIINEPYFKVYGTGLSAGGDFSTNGDGQCTGGGLLAGYTDNADPIPRGTGTQLSALALIKITGVASAQKSYPTSSPAGTALTFANTKSADISSSLDSPSLGGNFDPGGSHCLTDQKPPSGTTVHNGNYTLGAKSNISNDQSVFVNGNVRITGNVTYINSWNIDNAPSFVLRATGNIYIDPGVTRLDGTYISNKTIYTCSNNSFSPRPASAMHGGCKNQLVFNGSVVAKKINLMRTFGSLRDERPVGAVPAGSQIGFKWSSAGPIAGMKCTRIDEPADPDTWHDNYLCIPSSSSLKLAWTHHSNNTGSDSSNIGSGNASLSYIQSHGYPNCTKWDVPADYSHTWQDNYLCSNEDKGLSFRTSKDGAKYCETRIIESADPQGQWKSGYYLCENQAPPAIPGGTPAAPACSNKGTQLITSTCAAEIFNFSPELYLSTPAIQLPNNGAVQYDAVTSLPPVL